jgi:hypothetical protein
LCAHHAKQPLLCALLTPFPRSPLAFPKIHVILHPSPGPPSRAARLWRSFDGGVGKERTSKAIASPRAQERIEPVACRQKSSRLSLNPHPTRGSPARSFEPHSKVCQEIRSKRFGRTRTAPSGCRKNSRPHANSSRSNCKVAAAVNPIARPRLSARQSRRIYGGVGVAARPTPRPSCPSARALKTNPRCAKRNAPVRKRRSPSAPTHAHTVALSLYRPVALSPTAPSTTPAPTPPTKSK